MDFKGNLQKLACAAGLHRFRPLDGFERVAICECGQTTRYRKVYRRHQGSRETLRRRKQLERGHHQGVK